MFGFQPALITKVPSTPPELTNVVGQDVYDVTLKRLEFVEQQYKSGNVDDKVQFPGEADSVTRTFEEGLSRLEKAVLEHRERLLAERPASFYKFIAIQAELKEYFDTTTVTNQFDLYLFAQELYRDLQTHIPENYSTASKEERAKINNIIRVIVAGLEYLHTSGDFATALNYGRELLQLVVNKGLGIVNEGQKTRTDAEAPLALLYQFMGRILRARGIDDDYQKAIDYFYKCNESYAEIALQDDFSPDDIIYTRTRAAVSLAFGAGFLFYNAQGDLVRAKDVLTQARLAFLRDSGAVCCKLYYHYLELLYASILREEAGELSSITHGEAAQVEVERISAQAKLKQADKIIQRCAGVLENRPKYFIHVLFNQALVCIYQGTAYNDAARDCIEKLFDQCQSNARWLANAFVLKSHLERQAGDLDTALADAIKGYSHAGNYLPVKIEALLARGQAQLLRNKLTAAHADFEKAQQLNDGANLKLTALSNLLMVELALEQQQPKKAYERFVEVSAMIPWIRHGSIINKHRQLSARLDKVQTDYLITGNTEVLHYKKFEKDLQRWLLEKALREDKNVTRVAKRLQVTKKTIYMWLNRYNIKH